MANPVIHAEVTGKDAPALQKFYSQALGWNLDADHPGGYGMTSPTDTGIVVGVGASHDGGPGMVTFYVKVADLDETLRSVTAAGGAIVMPKFSPGEGAQLALIADPEGHVVGLTE